MPEKAPDVRGKTPDPYSLRFETNSDKMHSKGSKQWMNTNHPHFFCCDCANTIRNPRPNVCIDSKSYTP